MRRCLAIALPVGRNAPVVGGNALLVGGNALLAGRNALLVGRNALLVGGNALLVGRNAPLFGAMHYEKNSPPGTNFATYLATHHHSGATRQPNDNNCGRDEALDHKWCDVCKLWIIGKQATKHHHDSRKRGRRTATGPVATI